MFDLLRFILIIFLSVCLAYLTQLAVPLMSHPKQLSAYCSYLPSTHCAFALQQRYSTRKLLPFVYRAYVLLYAGRAALSAMSRACPDWTGNSNYKWNIHFNSNETRSPISI